MKTMITRVRAFLAALAMISLPAGAVTQVTDVYFHNDLAGTPVAATDSSGALLWRQTYKPYGERIDPKAPAELMPWYSGKPHVQAAGISYFGARWYDPQLGRFMSVDPVGFSEGNIHSFNRYSYANNNPYRYVDPDGRMAMEGLVIVAGGAVLAVGASKLPPDQQKALAIGLAKVLRYALVGMFNPGAFLAEAAGGSDDGGNAGGKDADANRGNGENSNPYAGPVDKPVVVVDPQGNAIPVDAGQKITASPNGEYQQVRDREGNATGLRLDRGGHKNHADPRARDPHAHVPGVTLPDGNPHLPLSQP